MLTCGFCDREFSGYAHIKQHLYKEYNVFSCEFCKKPFISAYLLQRHGYHCSATKEVTCVICETKFASANLLREHEDDCRENFEMMMRNAYPVPRPAQAGVKTTNKKSLSFLLSKKPTDRRATTRNRQIPRRYMVEPGDELPLNTSAENGASPAKKYRRS
ncbi:unnamed protein product [Caenorhabditis bovis]|nr:unnamed protein product [Caenorhabditis bovis]